MSRLLLLRLPSFRLASELHILAIVIYCFRSQTHGPVMNWSPNPDEKSINLIIIGSDGLAGDLVNEIRVSHHQQMISLS